LVNSPILLWGSSIENLENNYPNVFEDMEINPFNYYFEGNYGDEKMEDQIVYRAFSFFDNKLFKVEVCYRNSYDVFELLMRNILRIYGETKTREYNKESGKWIIKNNKYTEIEIKIIDHLLYVYYTHLPLEKEYLEYQFKNMDVEKMKKELKNMEEDIERLKQIEQYNK
jgi:hypothetical protein